MYHVYFGLKNKPFQINTDASFLWVGDRHKDALSVFRYGLLEYRGFMALTGDSGTGKTMFLNAVLENRHPDVLLAKIADPEPDLLGFINSIAISFGINVSFQSKGPFIDHFEQFLNRQYHSGKTALLIIEKAQHLTHEQLEEIRVLSNLEKPSTKLLNVLFVGNDTFNEMLLDDENRSIRQRITFSYHLEPLDRKEVGEYIWHHQQVAGAKMNLFTKNSIDCIYVFSGGLPFLINIICDCALRAAYTRNKRLVSDMIVSECARILEERLFPKPDETMGSTPVTAPGKQLAVTQEISKPRRRKRMLSALSVLLLLLGAYFTHLWIPASAGWFDTFTEEWITGKQIAQTVKQKSPAVPPDSKKISRASETPAVPEKILIHFHHDGHDLDPPSVEALDQAKDLLRMNPELKATVVGYTDSVGNPQYNLKLSRLRANIVEKHLSGSGINPDRIDSKGMGIQNPVASNDTLAGRRLNRRVEILFYPDPTSQSRH